MPTVASCSINLGCAHAGQSVVTPRRAGTISTCVTRSRRPGAASRRSRMATAVRGSVADAYVTEDQSRIHRRPSADLTTSVWDRTYSTLGITFRRQGLPSLRLEAVRHAVFLRHLWGRRRRRQDSVVESSGRLLESFR